MKELPGWAKLERAKRHILDLRTRLTAFLDTNPYPFTWYDDPQTEERVYTLVEAKDIPVDIPLITGDAVHDLRSTLDHIAYGLACLKGIKGKALRGVYFPLGKNTANFENKLAQIKNLVRPDALQALRDVEAYAGGKGEAFWQLDCLDNIDKHRLLLTVNSLHHGRSMRVRRRTRLINALGLRLGEAPHRMFLESVDHPLLGLKPGDELDRVPKSEIQEQMYFPFNVAFGQPEAVKGRRVLQFLNAVRQDIETLTLRFNDAGLYE